MKYDNDHDHRQHDDAEELDLEALDTVVGGGMSSSALVAGMGWSANRTAPRAQPGPAPANHRLSGRAVNPGRIGIAPLPTP